MEKSGIKILVAAGGTGGHLFPALAVVEQLEKITGGRMYACFTGSSKRIESKVIPDLGYDFFPIPVTGFYGIFSFSTLTLPFKIYSSIRKCRKVIRQKNIDAVICTGAYLSYPAGIAASQAGIPLILMESNVYPGKTIRMLAPKADLIITAFEDTSRYLPQNMKEKIISLGNPVRNMFTGMHSREEAINKFGLKQDKKTVLIFGGSLGAASINRAAQKAISALHNDALQFIWQTGKNFTPEINIPQNVKLLTFIDDMASAYAAADLVIARSGATTVAELCLTGKPSVLVPLSTAANNEQESNARVLEQEGAAIMYTDFEIE